MSEVRPVDDPAALREREQKRFELYAAIVLGIAALATAWAAFQSGKLGGDEIQAFTESNQALADANFFYAQGQSQVDADGQLFLQYAIAANSGDAQLAEYIRGSLMSAELQEAVAWWEADPDAVTPFDESESNPYAVAAYDSADELQQQAEDKLTLAQELGARGDQFDLASVFLAVALFFGGISIVFDRKPVVLGLIGVAVVLLVFGLVVLAGA